jgi:large subunit ribosomal protein L1
MAKRFNELAKKVNPENKYTLEEAFKLAVETATAKFNESIDVSVNLGVDAKQSDQQVRGAVSLPHGLGKTVKILVFAKGDKEREAKEAGADFVGAEDLIEKINGGWLGFDKAIATPDMMVAVSKVARVLGPRGLMPNPKVGTVTFDVAKTIQAEKKGKLDFRIEKAGIVQVSVGKKDMGNEKLQDNFLAFLAALMKAKPSTSKGNYIQAITVSSTMGPGIKVDVNKAQALVQ